VRRVDAAPPFEEEGRPDRSRRRRRRVQLGGTDGRRARQGLLIDDVAWAVRFVQETRGRTVLVPAAWIDRLDRNGWSSGCPSSATRCSLRPRTTTDSPGPNVAATPVVSRSTRRVRASSRGHGDQALEGSA
jgi:hypothetical protein